jgi:hypothetical protein
VPPLGLRGEGEDIVARFVVRGKLPGLPAPSLMNLLSSRALILEL